MGESGDDDVTTLLESARLGDAAAANLLATRVHEALHRIAVNALKKEQAGHTLQPTELVDEAFVRLIGHKATTWENRSQFYALAARTIRRILVDHARRRRSVKRDGGIQVTLDESISDDRNDRLNLIALDDALKQLDALQPRQAQVVELRFFGGLDVEATAHALGISPATVKRDWTFARAFLLQSLSHA
jgi:RNA polymerase sigma factor (TIGR02999 family)